ncbi:HEAT repeat domain-containing protein [Ktedonobacteria bacterium brp13]|nr:HEAT repeat domain-containing protein [Ktedonobacteria bacterium brp13]
MKQNEIRLQYLDAVFQRYSSVTLPLGTTESLSLQAIFQPLALRHEPLAAEDLPFEQRRLLLGERDDDDNANSFAGSGQQRAKREGAMQAVVAEHGEEALARSPQRRVVILGTPGTGKTTTLKYLVSRYAEKAQYDEHAPLPIFLSLAELAQSGKSLQYYLHDVVANLHIEPSYADVLWQAIAEGNAFVALDSLDEVSPALRARMIDLVNYWAGEAGNTWLVGSRFTEYKGGQFKAGSFSEWELLPLSPPLRSALAEKLFAELQKSGSFSSSPLSSSVFLAALEAHPNAASWGQNPLLLSLAAIVYVKTGALPASRVILYQEVIEAVLASREKDTLRRKQLLQVFSRLAFWLYQRKGRTFTYDDILLFLDQEQRRSIAEQLFSSGLLDVVAHETYGFRHQTFQEYLVAIELAANMTSEDQDTQQEWFTFAWDKRMYSRWSEILRMTAGIISQSPDVQSQTLLERWFVALLAQRESPEGDLGDLGLMLVIKSLSELNTLLEQPVRIGMQLEQQVVALWLKEQVDAARHQRYERVRRLSALGGEIGLLSHGWTDEIFEQLRVCIRDRDDAVSNFAQSALDALGKYAPLEPLVSMLQDADMRVRHAVVEALGKQGERVRLEVLEGMLQDADASVRRTVVEVLGEQGERAPLEVLEGLLQDTDEDMRYAVVEALGKQGERVPLTVLERMLQDAAVYVRSAAVEALGKQGERVPLDVLEGMLQDVDGDVRNTVVEVLGEQRERVRLEVLEGMLQDADEGVRSAAVAALGKQGERVRLEVLEGMLQDSHANVRRDVVAALGEQGERVPLEVLERMLRDASGVVRRAAVEVLGKQGERVPLEVLEGMLRDASGVVRQAAVEVLGKQGERVPLEVLEGMLQDEAWLVRRTAVAALGKQSERVRLEVLEGLLQDSSWSVRSAAVTLMYKASHTVLQMDKVITYRNMDSAIKIFLIKLLTNRDVPLILQKFKNDAEPSVRRAVAEALGKQGERAQLEVLEGMLQDSHADVRRAVVVVLGKQGERARLEALEGMLQDTNEGVRSAAVAALGKQGERVRLDVLEGMLQDEDRVVRRAAVAALGKQGERAPLDVLEGLLQDANEDVRSAVVEALGKQGERVSLAILEGMLQDAAAYVRRAAVAALGKQGERVPLAALEGMLQDAAADVRRAAVGALEEQGERVKRHVFVNALKDTSEDVRIAAVQALNSSYPDVLDELMPDVRETVETGVCVGEVLCTPMLTHCAEMLGNLKLARPDLLTFLTDLLDHPYWETRLAAIRALGEIRRNIPDWAIKRLMEMRLDASLGRAAWAADAALAEILSLETGIEDD